MTTLAKITLPMPRLGETMEQGTIANWLVEAGAEFKRGDPLLELETDKTLVEYPALGSGKLLETLVGPGDIVDVDAPIAVIETEDAWDGIASVGDASPHQTKSSDRIEETLSPQPKKSGSSTSSSHRATPLARRIARQRGIDLAGVTGSGRRGRIEARDVNEFAGTNSQIAAPGISNQRKPGTDLPILFIHGFAGVGSNWEIMRASLQRGGVKTSAPDMPGHGQNASDASSVDDLIEWLTELLAGHDAPVHLVGHSLGAHVAAMATKQHGEKVDRLTLIAPAGCGHEINGTFLHGIAASKTTGELRHLLRLLGPKASKLPDDAVLSMANELAKGRLIDLADAMARGDTQCIDTISAAAQLSETVPVSAVFGISDLIVPKEQVFNMPPRVASHVVRTGHMPHWDAPNLLERIITAAI